MRRLGSSLVSSWSIIVTLGLGIGLAAATGVVARAVAFDGLPIRDADRVLMLWGVDRAGSFSHLPLRPADVASLTERMRGVADVAPADYNGATVWPFHSPSGSGAPLRLRGTLAGGRYFDVLGAVPVLGRALRAEDDVIGAERVMVLSHAAWRRHFGGDLRVIGRSLKSVIFGATYTIVGVMPPGLDVPRGVEFWTAFTPSAAVGGSLERSPWAVDVLARIAPGGTSGRVEEVLTSFYASLADKGQSQYAGARATSRTVAALVTGDVRAAFGVLAAAAALVLVVTCGNVGGLLLLQASGRRRELALRAALGASRATLLRTLAARHAVLALAGGAVGLLVAIFAVSTFARMAPPRAPARGRSRGGLAALRRADRGHGARRACGGRRIRPFCDARVTRCRAGWCAPRRRGHSARCACAPIAGGGTGGAGAGGLVGGVVGGAKPRQSHDARPGDRRSGSFGICRADSFGRMGRRAGGDRRSGVAPCALGRAAGRDPHAGRGHPGRGWCCPRGARGLRRLGGMGRAAGGCWGIGERLHASAVPQHGDHQRGLPASHWRHPGARTMDHAW
jgi:hypothetical protein